MGKPRYLEISFPLLGNLHQNISVFLLLHHAQGPRTSVDVLLPPHDREVPPSVLRGFTGVSDYWVTLAAQRHWALDLSPSALCSWRKKPIGNEFSLAALGFQFLYFVPSLSHLSGSTPPVWPLISRNPQFPPINRYPNFSASELVLWLLRIFVFDIGENTGERGLGGWVQLK